MKDSEIINLFWQRNEKALFFAQNKYGKYCITIAKNILSDIEDAKECVNDTYLKTWNSIPPHRPNCLCTFLGKITRNTALSRYRYNKSGKRTADVMDELLDIVSDKEDVESEMVKKELVSAVNSFLSSIEKDKRDIFLYRYWYFFDVKEIADKTGKTPNNISVILLRLRKDLKEYLNSEGFEI